MKYNNLLNFKTPDQFVNYKLSLIDKEEFAFSYFFKLMFSEENNVMFEEGIGFKINKITYGEAKQEAIKYANSLRAIIGEAPHNSVIGLNLDNSHYWIECFWAILKCGCRPLLLNKRLDVDSLNNVLTSTNAVLVISDDDKRFKVKTIRLEDLDIDTPSYDGEFGEEIFVMSSGTTSNIKVCAYSANEFKYIIKQSKHIVLSNKLIKKHYKGELKLLAFLPFYHIFGLIAVYTWFGFYSRTFVRLNDLSPATIQNTIKRHHVTHIFAVPLLWKKTYESVIREIKGRGEKTYQKFLKGMKIAEKTRNTLIIGKLFRKLAFKEIRDQLFGDSVFFTIAGGSMIENEVLSFFNYIGYHLANGYGMSEVGITSVELSNNMKYLCTGSIGKPLPYIEYKIDDNCELSVKSLARSVYILEGDKLIKNDGEYFLTHDIAKKIKDRYYLFGRQDDLVISFSGENLNPNIIESKLYISGVNGLCLILNPENSVPTLLVGVNRYISQEKAQEIKEEIKNKLIANGLDQQIGKVELVTSSLIQGDEFKMNRKRLTQDYAMHKLETLSFVHTSEEVNDSITKKIKELFAMVLVIPEEDIDSESDFFSDYGGTSLDLLVIDNKIKEEFEVSIMSEEPIKYTVKNIVDLINRKL